MVNIVLYGGETMTANTIEFYGDTVLIDHSRYVSVVDIERITTEEV